MEVATAVIIMTTWAIGLFLVSHQSGKLSDKLMEVLKKVKNK